MYIICYRDYNEMNKMWEQLEGVNVFLVWGEGGIELWDCRVIHEKRFEFIDILYRNDRDSGRNKNFFFYRYCDFKANFHSMFLFTYLLFSEGIVMGAGALIETEEWSIQKLWEFSTW